MPHEFIKVQCVAIAVHESQQLLMPNSLWCNGDRQFFSLNLCSSTVTLLSLSSKETSVLLLWRKKKKKKSVLMSERWNMCDRGTVHYLSRWVCVQTLHVPAARIRQKTGGGDTASLKLGAEPKATKLALDPTSLSPVETSSGIEHMRTVVLFKGNHFPLARSLNGYKMRSLSCHHRNARKT